MMNVKSMMNFITLTKHFDGGTTVIENKPPSTCDSGISTPTNNNNNRLSACGTESETSCEIGILDCGTKAGGGYDNGTTLCDNESHSSSSDSGVVGCNAGPRGRYDSAWNSKYAEMDITSGHLVLSYMEAHLRNENKLCAEWKALCSYEPEKCTRAAATDTLNTKKNRYTNILPYDHTRVKLNSHNNPTESDYINASFITDSNPRKPIYIATQGPLENTCADFWQMVWENNVVVILNLTQLSDQGLSKCYQYWPSDGSHTHHIYKIQLVSEHKWCEEYIVRNFFVKNTQTQQTRSVTQFQYLTWPDLGVPSSSQPLLEFRRKVNKCFRGRLGGPIVVHCNNGVGRTGTYILLDIVLSRLIRGAKEIDIAATLEHLRDQRADCVTTKMQFEFALLALAQEVSCVIDALVRR